MPASGIPTSPRDEHLHYLAAADRPVWRVAGYAPEDVACGGAGCGAGPRDRAYAQSQYRRRIQASAIIGLLGVSIAVWPIIPLKPWPFTLYMIALGGACLAITVLAMIDAWSTRRHYARLRSEHLATQLELVRQSRKPLCGPERVSDPAN